ncbi:MAG: HAD-IG family 5'-nucleotidase [Planctomycetes bacterium]|nr:HAD-IG family 5'-nucleotidase [Planctomycetota bacterium]
MKAPGSSAAPETLAHLFRSLGNLYAPSERLVYVNRDIDFNHIKVVGFDLDYTLARYCQAELEDLTLTVIFEKLYQAGFPEGFQLDRGESDFAMRGLVVDRQEGNILKLDRHGYVGRGYHGLQPLNSRELGRTYPEQRVGVEKARFSSVDTLFSLPEVNLFAKAVEHFDANMDDWGAGGFTDYAQVWDIIRTCTNASHQDDSIKASIRADPSRYIVRDPDLPAMLHRLRSLGKKIFLLTNSEPEYAQVLLELLLNEAGRGYTGWESFFDWIVVSARKPSFFTGSDPFIDVESGKATRSPKRNVVYAGGNQTDLQKVLKSHPDQILFVGDHIYDDVVKSKKNFGWRTALIVEELETDITTRRNWSVMIEEVEALRALRQKLSREVARMKFGLNAMDRSLQDEGLRLDGRLVTNSDYDAGRAVLLTEVARKRKELQVIDRRVNQLARKVSDAFNPYWGSLFWETHDTSRFAQQAETFACAYTSRASNLLFIAPEETLFAGAGKLAHSWRLP